MITTTEVKNILERHGYKITKQTVFNWIRVNRIDGFEIIDNSIMYDIKDLLPFIQKRIQVSNEQLQQELKEIRTILN